MGLKRIYRGLSVCLNLFIIILIRFYFFFYIFAFLKIWEKCVLAKKILHLDSQFLTWVMGLGGATRRKGIEDREAAVRQRGRGGSVHDRVTPWIDHVTCHRGGWWGDDRGWDTGCMQNKRCIKHILHCIGLWKCFLITTISFLSIRILCVFYGVFCMVFYYWYLNLPLFEVFLNCICAW